MLGGYVRLCLHISILYALLFIVTSEVMNPFLVELIFSKFKNCQKIGILMYATMYMV